ncbi:CaiB/BaiF CoA transferase family protein [Salipiger abyssi]|uniref:CaiB/BaiF CoA transferase family protein n=1 Tax=Salipiger abyssi TaxID=1250539 RepID=UPI001A900D57|nr:CoA transferase [Salipiger abyssi]MBN9889342.1 CoA transferase [Salipiger abyssi]
MPAVSETLPLEGVKVLELSHLIAGPYCCQLLAEEGAEVIKVEPPKGELARLREPMRRGARGHMSSFYAALNRDKKSLALDLKSEAGIEVFHELLGQVDVLVTNMRAAALERLGLHPAELHKRYPRLIIANISGFGLENAGEFGDRAGLAMTGEAMSGSTGMTRDREGRPVWCGYALGDVATGMTAHSAILLGLRNQERLGKGRLIDLTLPESLLPMLSVALARIQMADEKINQTAGGNNFHGVPYGVFTAKDGAITLGVNSDALWKKFARGIGRPELADDPRYALYLDRVKHQPEVLKLTEAFTSQHTRDELTEIFGKADVPVAGILSLKEVLESDYYVLRGSFREVQDGLGGTIRLPGDPTGFDDRGKPSVLPLLGEHNDTILTEYGFGAETRARLARAGAFGAVAAEQVA